MLAGKPFFAMVFGYEDSTGKLMFLRKHLSSGRPRGGCPPSAEGRLLALGITPQSLRDSSPFRGAFWSGSNMRLLVQLTSVTYASSKRQGVPAAVYGQPTECHGAKPKAARVVSPWEGSNPSDGWRRSWDPGASLSYMNILAGPRAALPTLPEWKVGRPSADG